MNLGNLLKEKGIETNEKNRVLVVRHRPTEPELQAVLPWLAAEKTEIFNAYQRTYRLRQEKALRKARYLASFIGVKPKEALFVGLYKVGRSKPISYREYWRKPANRELRQHGMTGFSGDRPTCEWFDLSESPECCEWKGKLIVEWPGTERAWCRWADRNEFTVKALLEESALVRNEPPDAGKLVLRWEQLSVIPPSLKGTLQAWRGIYFIFDIRKKRGYVGSAYGVENLYGRWTNYAKRGDGGNKQLRTSRPEDLRFSILELTKPQLSHDEVIQIEGTWKERLHTREFGLNDN